MNGKDEHGGDLPIEKGKSTSYPALGCAHCPAFFFTQENHRAHMLERHPDQPVAEAWQSSPEHKVTYFPHANVQTPHLYVLSELQSGKHISNMVVNHTGEIMGIETHPDMKRQGHATELLNAAKEHAETTPGVPSPEFSRTRTAAGDKFQKKAAKRLGGEAPTGGSLLSPRQMQGMLRFD